MNNKHGHKTSAGASPTYSSWSKMLGRCYNTNNPKYHRYGGRGIAVCSRWKNFKNFLEDMGEKPEGLTLDRTNNDKNYHKSNCRWATQKQQQNNKSNNRLYTYGGKTQNMMQWSEEYGIKYTTLKNRLRVSNWSIQKALEAQ